MQLMRNITLLLVIAFIYGEYLESHFEFVGHVPTPVDGDSVSKEETVSHCFTLCIQNSNCYSFDFCVNSITENFYQYNRNKTSTSEAVGRPCRRYKLKQLCEEEYTQPCRCPENRGGERCNLKFGCSGNLVNLFTSSYEYSRAFTNGKTSKLFCDMITDGGRWIVFQQQRDESVDFFRNWTEYSDGFGTLDTEFYLGNLALYEISKKRKFELRIDMTDQAGEYRYAKYSQLSVGSPESLYTLTVTGYAGNASDSLSGHNGFNFSTYDMDPENYAGVGCATMWHSGWWHAHCGISNLNRLYGSVGIQGLTWYHWKGTFSHVMKSTRMMMRLKEQ